MNDKLYNVCKQSGLNIGFVAEVGVYLPETSNVLGFIRDGCSALLVEPDPVCIDRIRDYFGEYSNVQIVQKAIFDKCGSINLFRNNASTFVEGISASPALVNDRYKPKNEDKFSAEAITFDRIDNGKIELLSVDTEGCEWFVLMNLISRPKVISLETHGKKYVNPYIDKITKWIENNDYKEWYKDTSDTVYIKKEYFTLLIYNEDEKRGLFAKLKRMFN
ncbi:MAG: hypothetical protein QG635_1185 [Bacteroidota bacterium]|nr:hypothetical protein [Bacteroidota bacterium]